MKVAEFPYITLKYKLNPAYGFFVAFDRLNIDQKLSMGAEILGTHPI